MKGLVVYGSEFGNTEKIARAIAKEVGAGMVLAGKAEPKDLNGVNLLFVGSPTQGGRPISDVQDFIYELPPRSPDLMRIGVFDTRFAEKEQGFGLRLVMKTVGYAAPKIASALEKKGYTVTGDPEGFIVKDKDGPLADGEIERAKSWASSVALD